MYLEQLKHFITVADLGSVTRAAEQLHISQPAISYSLKTLEEELGVSLFKRVKKRLTLTEEGTYYFEHVRSIMEQLSTVNQEMQDLSRKKRSLKLGVPPMLGTFLFPQIFSIINTHTDDVTFEPMEGGSLQFQDQLEEESIDMAIIASPHGVIPSEAALSHHMLSTIELMYCVSEDHPLANREVVGMAELKDEQFILYSGGFAHIALLEAAFRKAEFAPNVLFRTNQFQTIISFIQRNMATSFFYPDSIRNVPGVKTIHLKEPILLDLHLIWKKNRPLFREAKLFLHHLKGYQFEAEE